MFHRWLSSVQPEQRERHRTLRAWFVLSGVLALEGLHAQDSIEPTTVLEGHEAEVYQLAISADGKRLASASFDKTVRVWALPDGKLETTIGAHDEKVLCVTFAAGGTELVTGSHDKSVRVWKLADGSRRLTLEGHDGPVYTVAARDGDSGKPPWVAAAGTDSVIHLWDYEKGTPLRQLKGHEKSVYALAVHPEGKLLASGGLDTTVRLWDSATGSLEKTFSEHDDGVFCLAFSSDGRFLFSGSSDHDIRKWDVEGGNPAGVLAGHPHWICGLDIAEKRNALLSLDYAGNLLTWNPSNGKQVSHEKLGAVAYDIALTPDGAWVATANRDGRIFLVKRASTP